MVAIIGARQVGKTTNARRIARGWPGGGTFFDLEDARDLAQLEDPMLALSARRGLVVLDEVQPSRAAECFEAMTATTGGTFERGRHHVDQDKDAVERKMSRRYR